MTGNRAEGLTTPGHTAERVGFFTDAVFAIAMTLLVIEIPRPEAAVFEAGDGVTKAQAFDRLWRFLVAQHNAFYAYVLAFFILWIVWRQHHVLLDEVSRLSGPMIGCFVPGETFQLGRKISAWPANR